MARYDKYDGVAGGFRAPLFADAVPADYDKVQGASLNATGKVVFGAASNSGFRGVTITDRTKRRAGDIMDVMTNGEIVNCAGLTAGTAYFLSAAGVLVAAAAGGGTPAGAVAYVGSTVEADRLVVRFRTV